MGFRPTWLYVKRHRATGLMYFGKTVSLDPYKYKGGGVHWRAHLKKHGDNVETLWVRLFTEEAKCTRFALRFSKRNDIVNSKRWANLVPECGVGGAAKGSGKGRITSAETRAKLSAAHKGIPKTAEHNEKNRQAQLGRTVSRKTRAKLREAASNISEETRARMRAAKVGYVPHNKGKTGPPVSMATRRKLSAAAKGRPGGFRGHSHSAESKAKTSQALLGKYTWTLVRGKRVYSLTNTEVL